MKLTDYFTYTIEKELRTITFDLFNTTQLKENKHAAVISTILSIIKQASTQGIYFVQFIQDAKARVFYSPFDQKLQASLPKLTFAYDAAVIGTDLKRPKTVYTVNKQVKETLEALINPDLHTIVNTLLQEKAASPVDHEFIFIDVHDLHNVTLTIELMDYGNNDLFLTKTNDSIIVNEEETYSITEGIQPTLQVILQQKKNNARIRGLMQESFQHTMISLVANYLRISHILEPVTLFTRLHALFASRSFYTWYDELIDFLNKEKLHLLTNYVHMRGRFYYFVPLGSFTIISCFEEVHDGHEQELDIFTLDSTNEQAILHAIVDHAFTNPKE